MMPVSSAHDVGTALLDAVTDRDVDRLVGHRQRKAVAAKPLGHDEHDGEVHLFGRCRALDEIGCHQAQLLDSPDA